MRLVNAFSDSLRQIGNYGYVAETAVLRPTKDRPLYSLLYCTRRKEGIDVFRDCQKLRHRFPGSPGVVLIETCDDHPHP